MLAGRTLEITDLSQLSMKSDYLYIKFSLSTLCYALSFFLVVSGLAKLFAAMRRRK